MELVSERREAISTHHWGGYGELMKVPHMREHGCGDEIG